MANSPYKTPPSHRLTVSSLLSPPEMKRSESFGSSIAPAFAQSPFSSFNSVPSKPETDIMAYQAAVHRNRDAYASPPISPFDTQSQKENMDIADDQGPRDPQLFVSGDTAIPVADVPLFPQEATEPASQDIITEHMKSSDYAQLESKPSREDYELAISFRSTVFGLAVKNPRRWWEQERRFDQYYGRPSGVQKRPTLKKLAPAPSSRPRQPKVALPRLPPRTPRAPKVKRTPQAQIYDSFDYTPASASPKLARPATNRDDTDYNALPDYSPPLDTLPKGNNKSLKAEWKGTVLDLSNDPDRHMLHEAELHLAATLRLNCATYLCSKRRVFQARIDALRIGKEFRKTDAQQACKIDVNKASKLWQSYDRVGWFNPDYFRRYL
ncbi:Nn.00g076470.m01.CDS01 [Neocucurbitaria sp. VM-36]